MHKPEQRSAARQLYVRDRLPLTQISERLSVAESTLRRWKSKAEQQGDDWEAARSIHTMTDGSRDTLLLDLIQDYVALHKAVLDQIKDPDASMPAAEKVKSLAMLADSFSKTMASAEKVSPKLSRLAVATDVLQRLGEFVMAEAPESAAALLEVLEPFGQRLAKIYGKG